MIVARDRTAYVHLALGKLGDAWVVASETCAFDINRCRICARCRARRILLSMNNGLFRDTFAEARQAAMCAMEYVYFARPDSNIDGINVHMARKNVWVNSLAHEVQIDADVVTGVPDSVFHLPLVLLKKLEFHMNWS